MKVAPQIEATMADVEAGRAPKKSMADEIVNLLINEKLAYVERVANDKVGCHPANRGGAGL